MFICLFANGRLIISEIRLRLLLTVKEHPKRRVPFNHPLQEVALLYFSIDFKNIKSSSYGIMTKTLIEFIYLFEAASAISR